METKITATELARNLSDILNRVRYKGERFAVVRNGETIAVIEAPVELKRFTVRDFVEVMKNAPRPDDKFVDDMEEILKETRSWKMPDSPWDS